MESNFIIDCLNNRQFGKILDYISEQLKLNGSEIAQMLRVPKGELESYTGNPANDCLETKLGIFAEFARLGFDGRLKATAEALVNDGNAEALSKLCGVGRVGLKNPEKCESIEEKYRLAVGMDFLAALYDVQDKTEKTIREQQLRQPSNKEYERE